MDDPDNADTAGETPEARLGAELRRLRVRAGLSVRGLAEELHRAHSGIVEYERGRRLAPVEVIEQYEEYFGLSRGVLGAQRERARVERLECPRDGTLAEHLGEAACPYKGLRAFESADAALFFGREAQVDRVLKRLAEVRIPSTRSPALLPLRLAAPYACRRTICAPIPTGWSARPVRRAPAVWRSRSISSKSSSRYVARKSTDAASSRR